MNHQPARSTIAPAGETARSVHFAGVAKRFGGVTAVENVTFEIRPGQFMTLLGPSGCGKSTTLGMIAGLELPSEGRIFIGDRDVTTMAPADRDIAMVFQSYALYPHLTIFENIAFPLRARRRRTNEADLQGKVAAVAEMLGLASLLGRYPREISGGQRQRVALGRAMVRRPTVYLLDEPLSNLDQQLRVMMRSELKDMHQRLGATMLYVTHDQGEAMTLSDVIAVMSNGRIEQIGSPRDLYDRPANLFVARFLGEPGMNIFAGDVVGGRLVSPGISIALPGSHPLAGKRACAGIRPEHFVVAQRDALVSGVVRTLEFLGSRSLVRVDVGDQLVTAFLGPEISFEPGQVIGLGVSELAKIRWFDAESGQALAV